MANYKIKNNSFLENFYLFLIFFISYYINFYYANKGVFPLDTFLHFDSSFRILNNELPVRDFFIVHGIFIDYLQALFFKVFNSDWQSYLIHSSLMNSIISIFTFYIFRLLDVNKHITFVFCIFIGILAYPSSGTPFLDHHSTFLSLIGIYFFILALKKNLIYCFFLPYIFGFAFLSKQVPAAYIIICISFVLILCAFIKKNMKFVIYPFFGSISFLLILAIFFILQSIEVSLFFKQYILFPLSIGSERYINLGPNIFGLANHFKFILLSFIPFIYFFIECLKKRTDFFRNDNFYILLIIFLFSISLIFHQILTKNQTFIFFLIPLNFIFGIYFLNKLSIKNKNIIFSIIILLNVFVTSKYHLRFNEDRKFHELKNINFNKSVPAQFIDNRLKNLNWISPNFKDPIQEINLIKFGIKTFENDGNNIMLITNYLFLDTIIEKNLNSTSRTFDPISFPDKNNKYYGIYRKMFINRLKNKEIRNIYLFYGFPVREDQISRYVTHYLSQDCFKKEIIRPELVRLKIKDCKDLR